MGVINVANTTSNFIYFDKEWFETLITNGYDIDEYYTYCEESNEKYSKTIKERKKLKDKGEIDNMPNIFEEGKVNYMKLARVHLIKEPSTKAEMIAMMIFQYAFSYCKMNKHNMKVIKFSTLEKVFGLTEKQLGQIILQFGEDYFLNISSKQDRIGRPKKIYYANVDVVMFTEQFKELELDTIVDETLEVQDMFGGEIDWI